MRSRQDIWGSQGQKHTGELLHILCSSSAHVYWKRRTKSRGMGLTHSCWIPHQSELALCSSPSPERELHSNTKTRCEHAARGRAQRACKQRTLDRTVHCGSGCGHWSEPLSRKHDTLWEEKHMDVCGCVCGCVWMCVDVCAYVCLCGAQIKVYFNLFQSNNLH